MPNAESSIGEQLRALDEGRAAADLSHYSKVSVRGRDAAAWLNDLVTARVEGMKPGEATRSLLLSPTGHIRAAFGIARIAGGYVLLQRPDQPEPVSGILEPYVLSSDVKISDVTTNLAVLAVDSASGIGGEEWRAQPSMTGMVADVAVRAARHKDALDSLADLTLVSTEALEARRIRDGIASFPADTGTSAIPATAGAEDVIDFDKGCFLGQESVAKVRNLGHAPETVVALRPGGPVTVGDPVFFNDRECGSVTGVAAIRGDTFALARVKWEAAGGPLQVMILGELSTA